MDTADIAALFAPHEEVANVLLLELSGIETDGAHDLGHILRVWRNVKLIQASEGGDLEILSAACLLHDCVHVAKSSPKRSAASRNSAAHASSILEAMGWPDVRIAQVVHAIEAHSYSAQIPAESLEAKILQDADRLDALGHIGIARCFYTAGLAGRDLYDLADPEADRRALDDTRFCLDHFQTKLLRLSGMFQTEAGAELSAARHETIERFLDGLAQEISLS